FELVPDKSKPEEPSPHGIFWILILLRFGACSFYRLRHLAESQTKLDVTLKLSGMKSAPTFCSRLVKLEKPEFNGPFCECRMIVEHMVAAAVIMVVSPVILPMGSVPDVCQC